MSSPVSHFLVPKHSIASEDEVQKLCKEKGITVENLPLINVEDAGIVSLDAKPGDVIKIERHSPVTGEKSLYYRLVVEE